VVAPGFGSRRRGADRFLLAIVLALALFARVAPEVQPALAATSAAALQCAATVGDLQPAAPTPGSPCWVAVDPYPFGSDGGSVSAAECATPGATVTCLTVTSFAFRAWNRGIATTSGSSAFAVWRYNGTSWYPDPTFPGQGTCKGSTVLWAGKLDFWLVGAQGWASLCRFDGVNNVWEPISLPAATLNALRNDKGELPTGRITSGACNAWNDCTFFGNDGVVVTWDGTKLTDDTPPGPTTPVTSNNPLAADYTAATAILDSSAKPVLGAAVAASTQSDGTPVPAQPGSSGPAQLYTSSSGSPFAATSYSPPSSFGGTANTGTDLVAVTFDASGRGWAAGDPPGWRAGTQSPQAAFTSPGTPAVQVAPLLPLGPSGASSSCAGPAADRFTHTNAVNPGTDSYLWSSVSGIPGAQAAFAGGQVLAPTPSPAPVDPNSTGSPEPVIVRIGCDGSVTALRFTELDPTRTGDAVGPVPVDRGGFVSTLVANAPNDAWAATTGGSLRQTDTGLFPIAQAPQLYRFTDGQKPNAAPGDDAETRPLNLKQDAPIIVIVPLPPPPPPAAAPVTTSRTQSLPPAINGIHDKVTAKSVKGARMVRLGGKSLRIATITHAFTLHITFNVVRPTVLGLQAAQGTRVVGSTKLASFKAGKGELSLRLTRDNWPTKLAFLTDAPTISFKTLTQTLTRTVSLSASAKAIAGRSISSIEFDYALDGTDTWTPVATVTKAPYTTSFDTTTVPNGSYSFRAVARDNGGAAAISPAQSGRRVQNP
jgi:hypothetical protein